MKVQRNTLLRAFLAVLVVAAVAAPTAFGSDLRSPDTQDAAKAGQWGRVSDRLLPGTQDAANGRGGAGPTIEVVTVAAPSGFDWVDSGIGAAFVLGLSLIGAGALLVVERRRRDSALTV